jgi:uncharacterized protein (TIGR02300 family)
VAKPELGTKRVCPVTGRKFYDLNKDPVISPYTGEVVPIVAVPASRGRPDAARAAAAPKQEEAVETQEVELVSLEDADAENSGGKKAAMVDDDDMDVDSDDDNADDDTTLIEDTEEGDDDVTDIIGDGREDEEEA